MLIKFSVENFKNFKEKLEWNISAINNYEFNNEAVGKYAVSKGMILGNNGSGKSNLGLAIFDIIFHLTDKEKLEQRYFNYLSLNSKKGYASFEYQFIFQNKLVRYCYQKTADRKLIREQLFIDNEEVIYYDFRDHDGFTKLVGTESMNLIANNMMSRVKYVKSNAILEENDVNKAYLEFVDFVDRMLLFYSLDDRGYQGFTNGSDGIAKGIIESGKLKDFEQFLKQQGINYTLVAKEVDGNLGIYCIFDEGEINFYAIASTGTRALALLYYWFVRMDSASFVFIDEFDAFYHFELAKQVITELKKLKNTQVFVSSHNTDLISNDLLRPDCYFVLEDGKISMFADRTDKELRRAHNLQKMYKAGMFDGK